MKHFLLLCSIFAITLLAAQNPAKPNYGGIVIYASGGFGGYDAPQKEDSVLVYITDGKHINFEIMTGRSASKMRHTDITFKQLFMAKKAEYKNIITPDKIVPTGNYDMNFSYPGDTRGSSFYKINLTHFGDGNTATLTVIDENRDEARINYILIVNLVKIK